MGSYRRCRQGFGIGICATYTATEAPTIRVRIIVEVAMRVAIAIPHTATDVPHRHSASTCPSRTQGGVQSKAIGELIWHRTCAGVQYNKTQPMNGVLTADSVSAKIFLDFSLSFFNCEVSAISDARSRRFST